MRDALAACLLDDRPRPAQDVQVRRHVERVVEVLQIALPVLRRHCDAHPVDASGHGTHHAR